MDKSKLKSTKKLEKNANKKRNSMLISDVKNIKENLKIKKILRNVKMNSSMRIKAPPGSKVMNNKDFIDNCDDFEESTIDEYQDQIQTNESPSATNLDVVTSSKVFENETGQSKISLNRDDEVQNTDDILEKNTNEKEIVNLNETKISEKPKDCSHSNTYDKCLPSDYVVVNVTSTPQNSKEIVNVKLRDRKLSLDQTILCGRSGLSQSELDLHFIGKSPLERKSSFFRKKMDSFLKNTTEIFKRQSSGGKSQFIKRRGSMSISLQSLSEQSSPSNGHYRENTLHNQQDLRNSATSISTMARSLSIASSLSMSPGEQLEQDSATDSQPSLTTSQPLGDYSSNSAHSLNEPYIQDSLLKNRAISMSSGLDAPNGRLRRKASKSNRVTWLASEGLTNYFKRLMQDEKSEEMQMCHSYQDFSSIPEIEPYGPTIDSKGRRLSYQKAVSGEDPVLPARYHDSTQRRRTLIPEHQEANYELNKRLDDFTKNGIPTLQGFCVATLPDQAFAYLMWAEGAKNIEDFYSDKVIPPHEEARQAVIRELVNTEAVYIKHIMALVEVFMAAAHSLQDSGFILDVDTERLFSNIPDVLNASLHFWNMTFYPMLMDAVENDTIFNSEFMALGFCQFRELLHPYEKYVNGQSKAIEYLRSLSNNSDFMTYLSWCHKQKECNRLQLSDMLVKPMQRLTKYSLILRRIIVNTDFEPERTSLIAMETFAKNYLLDINRSIRQREELEKLDALANSVDTFEIDFKDEDMDRYFRMFAQLNLKAPMLNCLPSHSRCLIYQGDLRFKDNVKETDVRVFLLTDMLLICKKLSKGSTYPYKMIRPKYMVDKMHHFPKFSRSKELVALIFVVLDDVSSSYHCFTLSESSKEEKHHGPIKVSVLQMWEHKVKEAKLSYELAVWFARNPSRDLSEVEMDSSSDYALSFGSSTRPGKAGSEELNIEREARERVAAMLHRSMGASTEYEFSQASMATDSFDVTQAMVSGEISSGRGFRYPMHRTSTGGSSRNSRLSSFQQSMSAASHDEPQPGPSRIVFRPGSSVEQHVIPPQHHDEVVTSITVNVVSESESETVVPDPPPIPIHAVHSHHGAHVAQSTHSAHSGHGVHSRAASASPNTLRVQPQNCVMALVHSLPDLTIEPATPRPPQSPSPQSASEKLYQSHNELLQRNRLLAAQQHQYLSPDHRGTSYPPPSPTRASLRRGLAFSYSFKYPPLTKMGHVNSQVQLPPEPMPSTSQQAQLPSDTPSTAKKSGSPSPVAATGPEKVTGGKIGKCRNKSGGTGGETGGDRQFTESDPGPQANQGNQRPQNDQGSQRSQTNENIRSSQTNQDNRAIQGNLGNRSTQGNQDNRATQSNQGIQDPQINQGNQDSLTNQDTRGSLRNPGNRSSLTNQGAPGNSGNQNRRGNSGSQDNLRTQGNQGARSSKGRGQPRKDNKGD